MYTHIINAYLYVLKKILSISIKVVQLSQPLLDNITLVPGT